MPNSDLSKTETLKPKNYISENWELVAESGWLVGQRFPISAHVFLGRDSTCDIVIPGTHLSRRHAELAIKGSKLLIRDLNSSNGTYVNDKRVTEAELESGDTVRFDVLIFRIHGPSQPVDMNATKIRHIEKPVKTAPRKTQAAPKTWKTKPTSDGNRSDTVTLTPAQKAKRSIGNTLAVILVIATLSGLGYLLSQL
jgi:predicted component of type VI protein secretion system